MDTVYNHQDGPYIQTFMFENTGLLILTDRGTEFAKPQLFEINHKTGEIRGNIFYCDAQMPSQKPHVENNHEFIRNIIPKKQNMKDLTQDELNLMFSHNNNIFFMFFKDFITNFVINF